MVIRTAIVMRVIDKRTGSVTIHLCWTNDEDAATRLAARHERILDRIEAYVAEGRTLGWG